MSKLIRSFAEFDLQIWRYFRVTLQVTHRLVGAIPKDPEVRERWIQARMKDSGNLRRLAGLTEEAIGLKKPTVEEAIAESATAVAEETDEAIAEGLRQSVWTGFRRNAEGYLVIEGRCVKALLKEAANILKDRLHLTAFKSRVAERVFVMEHSISLGVKEPHGVTEGFVHAMTPRYPITALKAADYVERPLLTLHVKAFDEPLSTKDGAARLAPAAYVEALFHYGQMLGLAKDRSQGEGIFELVSVEEIAGTELPAGLKR